MLKALKFVQGAVAKKDYVPALTHFHIKDGRITGSNGKLTLSSPLELDIDAVPKAAPFVKAIQACKTETAALHMTPAGRLSVRSGAFKAFVECLPVEEYPCLLPCGEVLEAPPELLPALRLLAPFIGEDASRPWARGVMFSGQSCYATNNICVVEHWLGDGFPFALNIPEEAVKELLRIGEEPTALQADERSMTFHFSGDRWLRTQLLGTEWPDVSAILDRQPVQLQVVPDGLFTAVAELAPFLDEHDTVLFRVDELRTSDVEGVGACISFDIGATASFSYKKLMLLDGVADQVDWEAWPQPCLFYNSKHRLRGAIMGLRG